MTKINPDICTSLYTSSDVKHVPQFTDVCQIEDNVGALREHRNKDKRVVSRETAGASRRLTQLTSLTSVTSAKTSVRFWFVIFSNVSSRIRSLKGNRRPHISHFLCSSFIKFDTEHFFTHQRESLSSQVALRHCASMTSLRLISLFRGFSSRFLILTTLHPPSSCPILWPCSAQSIPPTFLLSISLQQITICLQPLGHSPQFFWLQLQLYLY